MDTRDTPEQAELRRSARQLTRELGPHVVPDLDDATRRARLAAAVRAAGWVELRDDAGGGHPLASGVEAAIVADALGEAVADVAFIGPLVARDLARRSGVEPEEGAVVAFAPSLDDVALVEGATTAELCVLDVPSGGTGPAYVLVPDGDEPRLGRVRIGAVAPGTDLTRPVGTVAAGTAAEPVAGARPLAAADRDRWRALGVACTTADLVGLMRGVLDVTVAYAAERRQYGVPIGSFQAVQHLLAESRCLVEGASSAALHASWAVDDLEPAEALMATRVAKAYAARAARTVCETAVQVHGGIGNTWECIVHVYLRRALLSSQCFGDDGVHLAALARDRLGAA